MLVSIHSGVGQIVFTLFSLAGVACLPLLHAQEEAAGVPSVAEASEGAAFILTKAMYGNRLDSFAAAVGDTPESAAAPIVKKLAEQGIAVEMKMVGGTKAKPVVLGNAVNVESCTCMEAITEIARAAACEFHVLDKTIRFLYNGDCRVKRSYVFEREFIFSEMKDNTRTGSYLELSGSNLGLAFPAGCSMKYSISGNHLTVDHYPQEHAQIRKLLKEKYWAWRDAQSKGKKKNTSDTEVVMEKLSVIYMPPIKEAKECTVREAVDLLNVAVAERGIKMVLHKDVSPKQRMQLDKSAIVNGGDADRVLTDICAAIGADYKAKKNKVTIRPLSEGEKMRRYRISAQKFSELMGGRDVSSEEELKKALHELGIPTPAGTSVKWGEKKKVLILKSDDVSILRAFDSLMKEQGVEAIGKKKKK